MIPLTQEEKARFVVLGKIINRSEAEETEYRDLMVRSDAEQMPWPPRVPIPQP